MSISNKNAKRLALGVVGAVTAVIAGVAVGGIAETRHNLSSTGGANNNRFSGTAEICVFCHTPHGTDTSAPVPLWNRKLGTPDSFTTYDQLGTSTLDGKVAKVGSVSIACLSCHDGTQAMDAVINGSGSGNYDPTGATRMSGTWTQGNQTKVNTTTGKLGTGAATDIAMIGTDLRNDHPVGVQYAGGGVSSATPNGAFNDPDFTAIDRTQINGTDFWYVDAVDDNKRTRADIILYTRTDFAGDANAQPSVECASCHDPHVSNPPLFLRVSNTGSALCLACHIK